MYVLEELLSEEPSKPEPEPESLFLVPLSEEILSAVEPTNFVSTEDDDDMDSTEDEDFVSTEDDGREEEKREFFSEEPEREL